MFIVYHLKDIDLKKLWLNEMGWANSAPESRLKCDRAEEEFWRVNAPHYFYTNNLYKRFPELGVCVLSLLQKEDEVLEIGSGSGNFTIPMAANVQNVLGVEPSFSMLKSCRQRLEQENVKNVSLIQSKWEEFYSDKLWDVVVSVNSLYRIKDIVVALNKINHYAKRRCIIVRSIIRLPVYEVYLKCGISYNECKDYILIPNILWAEGINANVKYISVKSHKEFGCIEEVWGKNTSRLTAEEKEKLAKAFIQVAKIKDGKYIYDFTAVFAVIWWDKRM